MVLPQRYLCHLVLRHVEHARHTVLSIVLLVLLLPKVLPDAVDLALGVSHDRHARVGGNLLGVRVQHGHHDSWGAVVLDSHVRSALLHRRHLEIFGR